MLKSKRANIPVTLLVILTVVIYMLALILFIVLGSRDKGEVEGYEVIEEFNIKLRNAGFLGAGEEAVEEAMEKPWYYGPFGAKVLKIKVEGLS